MEYEIEHQPEQKLFKTEVEVVQLLYNTVC